MVENYVVVARRYRPTSFDELIGQGHVAQALKNAIDTNRVGHAYLFTGARGVGKTSSARILAKALNCENGPAPEPCNNCDICSDIGSGEDVDVLEIDGASNRGIDEIRQLRSNVNIRPSRARYKIYIIDEVHMLTMQAFNALLKTLEEPPEHVKFIFCTTDPEKIPITVLSRCQRFDFSSVDSDSIQSRLQHICENENVSASADALNLLARRAAGSMRDSQSLLEQLLSFCGNELTLDDVQKLLGAADNSLVIEIAESISTNKPNVAFQGVETAIGRGVDAGQLCEQLLTCFRDVSALLAGCNSDLMKFANPDDESQLKQIGAQMGMESVLAAMQILDQTLIKMRQSTHQRTLLEMCLVRAASLANVSSIQDLLSGIQSGKLAPVNSQVAANAPVSAAPAKNNSPEKKKIEIIESKVVREATSTPHKEISDRNAKQIWTQVLSRIEDMSSDAGASYNAIAISGPNKLVVTLNSTYNFQVCDRSDRKTRFEALLSEIAGREMKIEFRVDPKKQSQSSGSQANFKTKRQMMMEVTRDPFIARIIDHFDAEVVDLRMSR